MPFYISTLIFKALPLLTLSFFSYTPLLRMARARATTVTHWFPKESACSRFLSPGCLPQRWERRTLAAESEFTGSETWEHNHIWRAVWIAGAGCGSLLPHHCCDAIFDTSFAYTQHCACISLNLKEKWALRQRLSRQRQQPASQLRACYRHMLFNSLLYISAWCERDRINY